MSLYWKVHLTLGHIFGTPPFFGKKGLQAAQWSLSSTSSFQVELEELLPKQAQSVLLAVTER